MENTIQLPRQLRGAEIRAQSFDEAENTIDVVFSTGATVRRYSWSGDVYDERLSLDPSAVRLERLNRGAPFLNTHDSWQLDSVIGSVIPGSARIEDGVAVARVKLSSAESTADVVRNIRDGIIRNVSVGYNIHRVNKVERDDSNVALWDVVDWEPMEISAVPIPADAGAQIRSDNSGRGTLFDLYPCVFRSDATKESNMADAAKSAPAAAHGGDVIEETRSAQTVVVAPAPAVDHEALRREAIESERLRASTIADLARRAGLADIGDHHIKAGTPVDEFRSALLDKMMESERSVGPQPGPGSRISVNSGHDEVQFRAAAIESALLHRFDPARFELTEHGRQFRGMTLLEMGRECLEAAGVRTRGFAKRDLAGAILETRSGGMMSTSDFSNILANVIGKTLRQGYEAAPQTFRPITRIVTVPDFKEVSRTQLGEAPMLEKVTEHGEFKHGAIGESAEKYSIATYGKIVGVTRQVIIDDDLSALTRIPRQFGVQASILESNLVWAQILANANMSDGVALFHATHKNLAAADDITTAGVGAARALMNQQTGLDGATILNIMPSYIIVPSARQTEAEQFVGQIFPTATSSVVPESMRRLQVITEPRLDNGITIDGTTYAGSTSVWYLAGDTAQIDIVELAYLEGEQGVYTETRMGFDVDGMEVKVRLDVGAKIIDWRGLVKNPG